MRSLSFTLLALAFLLGVALADERRDLYEWVRHPPDWQFVGRADGSARLTFAIGLPHPNRKAMEDLFWAVSTPGNAKYRQFVSFDEVHRMSDPGHAVTAPVLAWLHSVSQQVETKLMGEVIHVTASVADIERLFDTQMAVFRHVRTKKPVIRHIGKTSVPASIHHLIQIVEGIHEFPRIPKRSHVRAPTPASEIVTGAFPFVSNQVPSTYYTLYNLPAGGVKVQYGSSNGIFAQFAADGAPSPADLTAFDNAFGIPPQKFTYNGQQDPTIGGEASLDAQMITTLAQNANTTFFMQQAWMYMFSTYLLSLNNSCPLVISVSYGWAEAQQCSDILHDIQVCQQHGWNNMQYIANTDQQFIKLGLAGRTFVVCSQDEGAPGETNDGCNLDLKLALYPEYPASSPYVTSVGATAIIGSGPDIGSSRTLKSKGKVSTATVALSNPCNGQYNCTKGAQTEMPCYLQNADFTTGGGFSQVEHQPTYQQATVAAYLKSGVAIPPPSKFNQSNRAYPDVGALGQNTLIVMNGEWVVTGGTSASTPITAGILTLLNDYLLGQKKAPLGFVNPLLYQMAAAQKNTFNQITTGNNKCTEEQCCKYGYLANPAGGWNPATGLGSPNYGNMLAYIQKNL